jgi:hypothetical protein
MSCVGKCKSSVPAHHSRSLFADVIDGSVSRVLSYPMSRFQVNHATNKGMEWNVFIPTLGRIRNACRQVVTYVCRQASQGCRPKRGKSQFPKTATTVIDKLFQHSTLWQGSRVLGRPTCSVAAGVISLPVSPCCAVTLCQVALLPAALPCLQCSQALGVWTDLCRDRLDPGPPGSCALEAVAPPGVLG